MIEEEGYWVIPVEGKRVTLLLIDYSFGFEFFESNEEVYSIRINKEFELSNKEGNQTLNPEEEPTNVAPALSILHQTTRRGKAYKNGDLEIEFENGLKIYVSSESPYEAWEMSGPDGLTVVGLSDSLAIWKKMYPSSEA